MSEFTNFSDADLIDTFGRLRATGIDPERCQRARDALSSRLRARSVEGLVGIKTEDLTEALQCMNRSQVLAEFRCREGQIDERTRDRWIAKVQRHIDSMLESAGWSKDRYKSNRAAIGRALQSAAGETMIPLREAIDAVNEASQKCPESQWGMMYRSDAIAALQALGGSER